MGRLVSSDDRFVVHDGHRGPIVGMTQYPKSIDMFVGIAMLGIGGFLTTRCIVGIVQWILQGMRRGKRVG